MARITRRRFLAISASASATALAGPASAATLFRWEGVALGARASIILEHPDAARITGQAMAEIDRLEDIFSLYRPTSALARLNRDGRLVAPPFELLECLGQCAAVHAATGGAFDPTIQPLWALYAGRYAAGQSVRDGEVDAILPRVGWPRVSVEPDEIRFDRPGMALTMNGIAQGYIADRVTAMLRREGLTDILVNTGELRALGGKPGGGDWPVSLLAGDRKIRNAVRLRDRALASSAPLGTVLDADGRLGHVIDPRTGRPASARWALVSVAAGSAAIADGLSTAGCLMDGGSFARAVAGFAGAEIVHLA